MACFGYKTILKGYPATLVVPVAPLCENVEDATSITIDFYTSTGETASAITRTISGVSISGNVIETELSVVDLGLLDDGVISYVANVDNVFIKEMQTNYYLKTPAQYVAPEGYLTVEEVEEIVADSIEPAVEAVIPDIASSVTAEVVGQVQDITGLTNYMDSAATQDYVQEALSGVDLTNYYTSGQTDEKIAEAISGIDYSDYYTSGQTDEKIAQAISAIDYSDYYTSGQTDGKIAEAISGIDYSNFYTSAQTQQAISAATSYTVDAAAAYTDSAISNQQFKTINGSGITGTGNLVIEGGSGNEGGYNYITKDQYDNWTTEERQEWYDNIIADAWDNDNFQYGILEVIEKTSSADTGYDQMKAEYRFYTLRNIEAGYNSLHFCYERGEPGEGAVRIYEYRITRGGDIESWSSTIQQRDGAQFSFTTGGTVYSGDYFDAYMMARVFGEPQNAHSFYAPRFQPIQIKDNNGTLLSVGNVISTERNTTDYTDEEYAFNIVFQFILNSTVYQVVGICVGQGDNAGWYLQSISSPVQSSNINNIWKGSAAEYAALSSYDSNTLYIVQ